MAPLRQPAGRRGGLRATPRRAPISSQLGARALDPDVVKNLATFEQIAADPPATPERIAPARANQAKLTAAIVGTLDEGSVDALLFPTSSVRRH